MGPAPGWTDFGWQGLRLQVPEDWNLGRVDGNADSGYVRLDDAHIVRGELEWRTVRGAAVRLDALVGRYLETLEKKARKAGIAFRVQRRADFLAEPGWLAGREHETFTWQADYQAYNLALRTGADRIALLRVLAPLEERCEAMVAGVVSSLRDEHEAPQWYWSVFGFRFHMPAEYKLDEHELRSGHIKLTFVHGRDTCGVERLGMARQLLRGQPLSEWYPVFFRKQLRDLVVATAPQTVNGHDGVRVTGRPRSRFRQLLRPLPWLNPRQRVHMDGLVWHCRASNRICVVDHQFRKAGERGDLTDRIANGYLCHQDEGPEAEPGRDAELPTGAQRGRRVGAK